jgi:sulfide:quinone oxidoreductase
VTDPDDTADRRSAPRGSGRPARRVVIAGAGVAALEALLALRALAGRRVELLVVAPGESFLHDATSIADSFAAETAPDVELTELLASVGASRTVDYLSGVDASANVVTTRAGDRIEYDELVVAVGARAVPALAGALAFRGRADVPALHQMLAEIDAGNVSRVVFVLGPGNAWPLPLYELAAATAAHIAGRSLRATVAILTAERAPLERLGPAAGAAITALLHGLGVPVHAGARASSFRNGVLRLDGGAELQADRVVALPILRGPAIDGLPADEDGFIPIDGDAGVRGVANVFAAGDATAHVLKHGGLAVAQADAAAEAIAARAGAELAPRPFPAVVHGLLLAAPEPLYVRLDAASGEALADDPAPDERPPAPVWASSHGQRPGALWWPPSRAAGRHLAPFMLRGGAARPAPARRRRSPATREAVELTVLLAEHDARAGDLATALATLDCAEALAGAPAPGYLARRRRWQAALEAQLAATDAQVEPAIVGES